MSTTGRFDRDDDAQTRLTEDRPGAGDRDADRFGREGARFHEGERTIGRRDEDLPELTRSEEELVVTKHEIESGRVRLVKRIVTESVTRTVEVRREVLHVERLEGSREGVDRPAGEPSMERADEGDTSSPRDADTTSPSRADRLRGGLSALQRRARPSAESTSDPASSPVGPQFAEGEMEIVLMEEEVVFSKRVVPRERVRLRRQTVIDEQRIDETLRKEEVELVRGDEAVRREPDRPAER